MIAQIVAVTEQITPRVAATAEAAAFLSLLSPRTRKRLLSTLDLLAEIGELVPANAGDWESKENPRDCQLLTFGQVDLLYRFDPSDAGILLESVSLQLN